MNELLKLVFSLSLSGSLLILVLLLCKPIFKNRLSKRWQYYIWLVVIARLLLPFAPERNLMETLFDRVEQTVVTGQAAGHTEQTTATEQTAGQGGSMVADSSDGAFPAESVKIQEYESQSMPEVGENGSNNPSPINDSTKPKNDISVILQNFRRITTYLGILWFGIAWILLIRKITMYQSFVKYIRAGKKEVSDIKLLDLLAETREKLGIKRPMELYINEQVSSPLLIGIFHPCIVLPSDDLSETDFQYTVRHELIHYRHCDVLYKWLVQTVLCLHWFNPLVRLLGKETGRACELACDEAVMKALDEEGRRTYGDVLVRAARHKGICREPLASVTLSESGELLKERLKAIGHFGKQSKIAAVVSVLSVVMLTAGAVMIGVAAPVGGIETSEETRALEARQSGSTNVSENIGNEEEFSQAASEVNTSGEIFMEDYMGTSMDISMDTLELKGTTYYLVFNEAQLRAIGTGEYGLDKNYMQQADIQMSEEEWKPIGTQNKPFTGSYNGNGFEIIGLTITNPEVELAGMFGTAHNAHIYNITLRDSDVILNRSIADQPNYPILAYDLGGSRVYDNIAWLSEESVTETIISASDRNRNENMEGVSGTDSNESVDYVLSGGSDRAIEETSAGKSDMSAKAEKYYENGSLSGFGRAFYELDKEEQEAWLNRAYRDEEIAFFSVALQQIDTESTLFKVFAERAYAEDNISFFSVLTDCMNENMLEGWLHKAIMDKKFDFQSVLYTALDRD